MTRRIVPTARGKSPRLMWLNAKWLITPTVKTIFYFFSTMSATLRAIRGGGGLKHQISALRHVQLETAIAVLKLLVSSPSPLTG
jgi:hypothetical protein